MEIEYKDKEERDLIVTDYSGKGMVLMEERNYFNGNFLIFAEDTVVIRKRLFDIEERVKCLEEKDKT